MISLLLVSHFAIWFRQHDVSKEICSLVKEKFLYSNILHIIAFLNICYSRHNRLWMNFASKTAKNFVFSVCNAKVRFLVEWEEIGIHFGYSSSIIISTNISSNLRYKCHLNICITNTISYLFAYNTQIYWWVCHGWHPWLFDNVKQTTFGNELFPTMLAETVFFQMPSIMDRQIILCTYFKNTTCSINVRFSCTIYWWLQREGWSC